MDSRTQQFHQVLKGVLGIMGKGMAVARLEVAEAVKCAAQGPGCVHPVFVAEVVAPQRLAQYGEHPFHGGFELLVSSARIAIGGGIDPGMVSNHLSPSVAHGGHRIVARQADRGVGQPLSQDFSAPQAEAAQKVVIAADVAIQGWLAHAELIGNPSKGQPV